MSTLSTLSKIVVIIATGITLLAALLVVAAWRNDRVIESDMGAATAYVLSAGARRSAISFVTPDGVTHNPPLGVLYPTKLIAGERINVEYYRSDPTLVRVTGRNAMVAIIPAGSVIIITWVIAGVILGTLTWIRRRSKV